MRKLASDLRAAGHNVWIDEAVLNIGDSLIGKIRKGLDQVDYVAAVLSKNSIRSEWVSKELEIASNRELEEKRVVVLPLLIEKVELPGFLKGKFYCDFTAQNSYKQAFDLLLRALDSQKVMPDVSATEIARLQAELEKAKSVIKKHQNEINVHRRIALRGKSAKLVAAIEKADKEYPLHTPINATYAFELANTPITLDYLLWVISKVEQEGSHPMEMLLSLENKWDKVNTMLEAYKQLLAAIESG